MTVPPPENDPWKRLRKSFSPALPEVDRQRAPSATAVAAARAMFVRI
jgi:hypothetical protein